MNYFNTHTGQIETPTALAMRGLPPDPAVLARAGIFPVEYPYPEHDRDTHALAPDGDPQPDATGTTYVQAFTVVPLPVPDARANLKTRIAARRYEAEMGGTLPQGGTMPQDGTLPPDEMGGAGADGTTLRLGTDVDARTRLQTAIDGCPESGTDGAGSIQYKLGGTFHSLTRAELMALRDIVTGHVQACFDKEATLFATIDAAVDVEALAGIAWKEGWPGDVG